MTHCAKCGAELIGSRRFCAACGTPAGDPRSPAASTGASPQRDSGEGAASSQESSPVSAVNPFARTAGVVDSARASPYGPPAPPSAELAATTPGVGHPNAGPHVSPLAVSNLVGVPGTRPMTSVPLQEPSSTRAAARESRPTAPTASKARERTQVLAPIKPRSVPPPSGGRVSHSAGARVTVTWSNGQRYAGTVQQLTTTHCLVQFPDGQKHWVELSYVAPA